MSLFLAVCVMFLALVIIYLAVKLQTAQDRIDTLRRETWHVEGSHSDHVHVATSPPSHDTKDVDIEKIIATSNDPVWQLVVDCRAVGLMNEWINKYPHYKGTQAHRKYGDFATWLLNLPDSQRTVSGVREALRNG